MMFYKQNYLSYQVKTGKLLLCRYGNYGKLDNNKLSILQEQQEDCVHSMDTMHPYLCLKRQNLEE